MKNSSMQRLEGLCRKAMQLYGMVEDGDAVCVGVSGGKDSVALALALKNLMPYFEKRFTVQALTLDPGFAGGKTDYTALTAFFEEAGIPHAVEWTDIGRVVFDARQEKNPCALCAKMRRGALHTGAKQLGCNKVALGHHLDDAVETFYLNLFGEGRIGCFSPVTWLSRKEVTVIRPMALAREHEVAKAAKGCGAPIVKSRCPVDGHTARADIKAFVAEKSRQDRAFCQKMLGAMQKAGLDGWGPAQAMDSSGQKKDGDAAGCRKSKGWKGKACGN